MAARGAREGNTNAKKADIGKAISLYLLLKIWNCYGLFLLSITLMRRWSACAKLARKAAETGINRLLLPDEYEKVDKLHGLRNG